IVATGEFNGRDNAVVHALRLALTPTYPELDRFDLTNFTVRILDSEQGTDAVTWVLVETDDTEHDVTWRTVGLGPNIIKASWEALVDAVVYGLMRLGIKTRG